MFAKKVINLSLLTGVGISGYLAGRYHEKIQLANDWFYDLPGIPIVSNVFAASPILEKSVPATAEPSVPAVKSQDLPAVKSDGIVPVATRVSQVNVDTFRNLTCLCLLPYILISGDEIWISKFRQHQITR